MYTFISLGKLSHYPDIFYLWFVCIKLDHNPSQRTAAIKVIYRRPGSVRVKTLYLQTYKLLCEYTVKPKIIHKC